MKIEEESPDLMVLDICMSVKDGIETLSAILSKNCHDSCNFKHGLSAVSGQFHDLGS